MRKYWKQLYANKFDNLNEMDKWLERRKLPKFIQKEIDTVNNPIFIKEISLFKIFPQRNSSPACLDWWILPSIQGRNNTNFTQTLPDNWRRGSTPNSFYEARITLIPKQDKGIIRKENKAEIPHKHGHKNSTPRLANWILLYLKIYIYIKYHNQVRFSQQRQSWSNIWKSINIIPYVINNKCKKKKIFLDVAKVFDEIQHTFLIKNLQRTSNRTNFPSLIKGIYRNNYG